MKIPPATTTITTTWFVVAAWLSSNSSGSVVVHGEPLSHPYIPFRTSPFDQPDDTLDHTITWTEHHPLSALTKYVPDKQHQQHQQQTQPQCPFQFSLGVSRRSHHDVAAKSSLSITQPPILYPVHPSRGPGKQVVYTTQYEHLDVLSPATGAQQQLGLITSPTNVKEGLVQDQDFPQLFESSSFHTSPLLWDQNGDGIQDAILTDYDGALYVVGLATSTSLQEHGTRFFHHAQLPRLFVRRDWFEARLNASLPDNTANTTTTDPEDSYVNYHSHLHNNPYYSYFEWSQNLKTDVLRGVHANVVDQTNHDLQQLENRRSQRVDQKREPPSKEEEEENAMNDHTPQQQQQEEDEQVKDKNDNQEDPTHTRQEEPPPRTGDGETTTTTNNNNNNNNQEPQQQQQQQQVEQQEQQQKQQQQVRQEEQQEQQQEQQQQRQQQQHGRRLEEVEYGIDHPVDDYAVFDDYNMAFDDKEWESSEDEEEEYDDAIDRNERESSKKKGLLEEEGAEGGEDQGGNEDQGGGEEEEEAEYPTYDDDYHRYRDYHGDDMYYGDDRYAYGHNDFYDEKHYVRIPPHVLSTPALAELPKEYSTDANAVDTILFFAVSYYFDEDEYEGHFSYKRFDAEDEGDETEERRGQYVANAICAYTLEESSGRWSRQQHLDMSGDYTAPQNGSTVPEATMAMDNSRMGAFALASPTLADVDGDNSMDVLLGTSMGIVYNLNARTLSSRDGWPVQMKRGVESRILVEDVLGDTDLEIFVMDVGGNLVCLDHKGNVIWHRDLAKNLHQDLDVSIDSMSPMTLGDVDGDGTLDLVVVMSAAVPNMYENVFVFAMSAATGKDLENFPFAIQGKPIDTAQKTQDKLPQPLLVDLHADQTYWKSYIQRNNTSMEAIKRKLQQDGASSSEKTTFSQGGTARGLHIVQPVGMDVFIIEGGSGCAHLVPIGDEVTAMVQADDVHGTGNLDLVVSTASGNIVTLDSPGVPYHPLNVWNNGELRNQGNTFAHGFSASQGIYVLDVSRQYRDIFGIYVPITFEIFDNRPNIQYEEARRLYRVDIRDGTSSKRLLFVKNYNATGTYTEKVYIPYGPGYYSLKISLKTTHGLTYEDVFHIGYNVHFLDGFGLLLWLPLLVAGIPMLLCSRKKSWEDDDFDGEGILGRELPS